MKEQLEKIDNVLITASTALLAAFVVLFTAESPQNIFFSTAAIVAVVFLVVCLLMTLYSKYRESYRKSIFDCRIDRWASNLKKDMDKLMEDYYTPVTLLDIKNVLANDANRQALQGETKSISDILGAERSTWDESKKRQHEYPRKLFVENQCLKLQNILNEAFSGPLTEKNSIIKYQIEIFSQKRFTLFVLGLICFIISVGIKLFI